MSVTHKNANITIGKALLLSIEERLLTPPKVIIIELLSEHSREASQWDAALARCGSLCCHVTAKELSTVHCYPHSEWEREDYVT